MTEKNDDAAELSRQTPDMLALREGRRRAERYNQRQAAFAGSAAGRLLAPMRAAARRSLLAQRVIRRLAKTVMPGTADILADADPATLNVFEGQKRQARSAGHVMIVSHELSSSGAPKIVLELGEVFLSAGYGVTVVSPFDGPMRTQLVQAGISVVISRGILVDGELLAGMARLVDRVICNTVLTHTAVACIGLIAPTYWYLHEISLLRDLLADGGGLGTAASAAKQVWAGSEMSAHLIRSVRPDVAVLPYGLNPLNGASTLGTEAGRTLRLAIFGAFEPRKGQDLAVDAVVALDPADRAGIHLVMFGRVVNKHFHNKLVVAAARAEVVEINGELTYDEYCNTLLNTDAVLVSSRDDTLPLVSLDALSSGRVLMCTCTTGTSAYLEDDVNGFVAREPNAASIAAMLKAALKRRADWPRIGQAGQAVFKEHFSREAFKTTIFARLELADHVVEPTLP